MRSIIGSAEGQGLESGHMNTRTGVGRIEDAASLVDRVTNAIRESIVDGRLHPGESLSITDLARDIGVSPSPVREALQRLAGQGLVVLRPSRSAMVSALDVDDLIELYRIRRLNEVDAVGRACPKLGEADFAVMERELNALEATEAVDDAFWDHHNAFHHAFIRPVMTPRLERFLDELNHAGERYLRVVYGHTDVFRERSVRARHQPLIDAARTGKATTMRRALAEHLEYNEREITRKISEILAKD